MKKIRLTIIAVILFASSSCAIIDRMESKADCSLIDEELNARYSLFDKLSNQEIKKRQSIKIPTISALDQVSVFSKIFEAVQNASQDAKMIPVDLRYYDEVALGNIIISNMTESSLEEAVQMSKYSQGFFALLNFGLKDVTIFPPLTNKIFEKQTLERPDLANSEIVINVSDSGNIIANMKFSDFQKVSIIADRIKEPYRMDLRESRVMRQRWIMPVYSIENSVLNGGKDTAGNIRFVNNKNAKINLDKFDRSSVACYKDISGAKFR